MNKVLFRICMPRIEKRAIFPWRELAAHELCIYFMLPRTDGFTFSKLFAPFSHDYYAQLVKRV